MEANMKPTEIRALNGEELHAQISNTRKSIVEMRFALSMRKLESPAKLRTARKKLARLLTVQTEQSQTKTDT